LLEGVTGVPCLFSCPSGSVELFVPRGPAIYRYEKCGCGQLAQPSWRQVEILPPVTPDCLVGQVSVATNASGSVEVFARVGKAVKGFGAYGGGYVSYTCSSGRLWTGPVPIRVS